MNLKRIRRELEALRANVKQVRPVDLQRLAQRLGRRRSRRGKEPNWISDEPDRYPISIPSHPGTLAPGTARNIIAALEDDLEHLETAQESGNGEAAR